MSRFTTKSSRNMDFSEGTSAYRARGKNKSDRVRVQKDRPPKRGDMGRRKGASGSCRDCGAMEKVLLMRRCTSGPMPPYGTEV